MYTTVETIVNVGPFVYGRIHFNFSFCSTLRLAVLASSTTSGCSLVRSSHAVRWSLQKRQQLGKERRRSGWRRSLLSLPPALAKSPILSACRSSSPYIARRGSRGAAHVALRAGSSPLPASPRAHGLLLWNMANVDQGKSTSVHTDPPRKQRESNVPTQTQQHLQHLAVPMREDPHIHSHLRLRFAGIARGQGLRQEQIHQR